MMIGNGAEVAEDWTWMQTSGYAMSFRQVPAKAAVATSNSFAALTSEEPESQDSDGIRDPVPCAAAPDPVASVPQRTGRSAKLLGASRRCSGPMASHCRHASCIEKIAPADVQGTLSALKTFQPTLSALKTSQPKLGAFLEKRTQSLRPLAAGWEKLQAILDSGASVTVVPPHVGRDYEVIRGEAAMAGVRYEIADGNEIPNLGEKLMPVVTREGTWRGLKAEVADIARALQSVRSLVKTGHKVVFGDGEHGTEHYIQNVMTGEVNAVEDDGQNYLMTYFIAPKGAPASFAGPTH